MLDHLTSHRVSSLEELIPLIGTEWTIFLFPPNKGSKPALYGRMWKIRALGIDAMVRKTHVGSCRVFYDDGYCTCGNPYVLIARREHENPKEDLRMR